MSIKRIRDGLLKIGMEENKIYEIIEHLYCEDNELLDRFSNKQTLKEIAFDRFKNLIKSFSDLPYKFNVKNIILSNKNMYSEYLYNYIMFLLKYDIKIINEYNRENVYFSDYVKMIIQRNDLDLSNEEIYKIYSFDKKMSLDTLLYILKKDFDIDLKVVLKKV